MSHSLFSYQIRIVTYGYGQVKHHEGRLWLLSSFFVRKSLNKLAKSSAAEYSAAEVSRTMANHCGLIVGLTATHCGLIVGLIATPIRPKICDNSVTENNPTFACTIIIFIYRT